MVEPGIPYSRGRLSTVDLLITISCFVNKENMVLVLKAADLNQLLQGDQLNLSFHFSKDSLVELILPGP
jgi:hypothetical protein